MENFYENFLKEIEKDVTANKATEAFSGAKNAMEHPETKVRATGTEIWKAILTSCEQVPESLRSAFVVQVLISILQDQEVAMETLNKALRKASDAVQRVEEAKQYRDAA
jgi:hypothetical protein